MSVEFNHIGLFTTETQESESLNVASGNWVSNPGDNKFSVEWIRPDPDALQKINKRLLPHIAFHVDSIEKESHGLKELKEPKEIGGFVTCSFYDYYGVIIELQQYHEDEKHWYDGKRDFQNNLVFDHIGILTEEKQKNENFIESSGVWVSNPGDNKFSVEWIRPDSDNLTDEVKRLMPHIAFKVKSIEEESRGLKEIMQPTVIGDFVRCAFYDYYGIVIELQQYLGDANRWYDGKRTGT